MDEIHVFHDLILSDARTRTTKCEKYWAWTQIRRQKVKCERSKAHGKMWAFHDFFLFGCRWMVMWVWQFCCCWCCRCSWWLLLKQVVYLRIVSVPAEPHCSIDVIQSGGILDFIIRLDCMPSAPTLTQTHRVRYNKRCFTISSFCDRPPRIFQFWALQVKILLAEALSFRGTTMLEFNFPAIRYSLIIWCF